MNPFYQHDAPFRSDKVLAHAKGQRCTLRFPGICNGNTQTTVPCHIRDSHKGTGIKASDSSVAFGCSACHDYLDHHFFNGAIPIETMLRCVIRGLQETLEILIRDEIVVFPHNQQRERRARRSQ